MSTKTKTVERNGTSKSSKSTCVWNRAFTANSEWPDKVRFSLNYLLIYLNVYLILSLNYRKNF